MVVCKVLESIIKDSVAMYLDKFNLIQKSQHGFIKNRSCVTNLIEYLEYCASNLDKGNPINVIYLDFKKAFDKVPHQRLIMKLEAIGICNNVIKWIGNWLIGKKQRVYLNSTVYEWSAFESGVPQGSVLGPLLFVIFINDIDVGILSKLLKFADDAKLFNSVSNSNDITAINSDLLKLSKWTEMWQMEFNVEKCKTMHIGCRN